MLVKIYFTEETYREVVVEAESLEAAVDTFNAFDDQGLTWIEQAYETGGDTKLDDVEEWHDLPTR